MLKNAQIGEAYTNNINLYLEKGYIRRLDHTEKSPLQKWYQPHFPVVRPDRTTTRTRIVFDASAKFEGVSLSDAIYQGPKLQRELTDVLLRFRRNPVALMCDIAEMNLRIEVAPKDRPYQRFLWRTLNQERAPDECEFNRVVFGVNSSPFQVQFVAQTHAENTKTSFQWPQRQWSKAGMQAHKWLSNSTKVLKRIPVECRASEVHIASDGLPMVKTLVVTWLPGKDVFTFNASPPERLSAY